MELSCRYRCITAQPSPVQWSEESSTCKGLWLLGRAKQRESRLQTAALKGTASRTEEDRHSNRP